MTPDERATQLRAELAALGAPEDDITYRLLDRVNRYTRAVDLDCMLAVDTILALRDQLAACRTIIEASDAEIDKLRAQVKSSLGQIDAIKRDVEILRDMLPEEVTDV